MRACVGGVRTLLTKAFIAVVVVAAHPHRPGFEAPTALRKRVRTADLGELFGLNFGRPSYLFRRRSNKVGLSSLTGNADANRLCASQYPFHVSWIWHGSQSYPFFVNFTNGSVFSHSSPDTVRRRAQQVLQPMHSTQFKTVINVHNSMIRKEKIERDGKRLQPAYFIANQTLL